MITYFVLRFVFSVVIFLLSSLTLFNEFFTSSICEFSFSLSWINFCKEVCSLCCSFVLQKHNVWLLLLTGISWSMYSWYCCCHCYYSVYLSCSILVIFFFVSSLTAIIPTTTENIFMILTKEFILIIWYVFDTYHRSYRIIVDYSPLHSFLICVSALQFLSRHFPNQLTLTEHKK